MERGQDTGPPAPVVRRLSRLHAALLTPYDAEGAIAHDCLARLVGHVRAQGIAGFYVGGSTGEGLLQTEAERLAVMETVGAAAAGGALMGHVGALSTAEACRLAKGAAALGYDAVSAIPPIYFPHRKDAIFGYYQDILAAAAGTPLVVYNIPAMSGVTFTLDDLAFLLGLPGVIGIKQTSIDMYQMEQLRRAFPDALLLNGYDEVLLAGLATGADGGIGSTYNVLGAEYLALRAALAAGDIGAAQALQARCNGVIDLLVRTGVFPGLKYLAHRLGILATPLCRRPMAALTAETGAVLDAVLPLLTPLTKSDR